jgi:hypothetical protein
MPVLSLRASTNSRPALRIVVVLETDKPIRVAVSKSVKGKISVGEHEP